MSQSVERLKELLFDNEAQALTDLARRLDGLNESSLRTRDDLSKRIEEVYARAGDSERLTASVAEILSDALRRAEIAKHAELSQSIAPLIVTTIKAELRNSQDEMVEALYPITGRLVKSYVASALKDLTDQMNRRIEQNAVMLRLQSLATGKSVAELALANIRNFDVKELYLIRRGSGALLAHWPDQPMSGREQAMSGVLAAINEFANEALSADNSSLRSIDLGGEEVYLRGSPIYLLAARCSGPAPKSIEQTLDDAFLSAVETQHAIDMRGLPRNEFAKATNAALSDVGKSLQTNVAADLEDLKQPRSKRALKVVAALILLPLLGWIGWNLFVDYRMATVRSTTERVIASDPDMAGYPVQIDVTNFGKTLSISGLTPSQKAKTRIATDLSHSLPNVTLQDGLTAVAGSDVQIPDVSPEIDRVRQDVQSVIGTVARAALMHANDRAVSRLNQAKNDLDRAASAAVEQSDADVLRQNISAVEKIIAEAKVLAGPLATDDTVEKDRKSAVAYQTLANRLHSVGDDIVRSNGGSQQEEQLAEHAGSMAAGLEDAVEQFSTQAERVAALSAATTIAKSMRPPAPIQQVTNVTQQIAPSTPQQKLEEFIRSHAIFFSNNLDYRNADTGKWLAELAELLKVAPAVVRIVGYTDEVGAANRNVQLAHDRAEKVRAELVGLGVNQGQLLSVGRASANDLSEARGPASPNRRVEFELGFEGEVSP